METTREIYWNVGHGLATLGPMYLFALAAVAVLVYGAVSRVKIYRQGQPVNRTDEPLARLAMMMKNMLLQARVTRVFGPGLAHAVFFWGFALLLVGTGLIVIQADFTDLFFDVVFLKGIPYKLFSIVLDIAGIAALVMLLGLLVRRWLVKPAGLLTGRDDIIMHSLLFAILVTGFLIEGARMAVTEMGTELSYWSPIGLLSAQGLQTLGEPALLALHKALWWLHLVLAMAFIAIIPFTKFRHILTTTANYFLADRGPVDKLTTPDLEDEDVESFGARQVNELTWKDLFDTDACTLCKRCQDRCPAHTTEKPLSPMQVVNKIGEDCFTKALCSLRHLRCGTASGRHEEIGIRRGDQHR
jgi:nitrate reductase gamma subunit